MDPKVFKVIKNVKGISTELERILQNAKNSGGLYRTQTTHTFQVK